MIAYLKRDWKEKVRIVPRGNGRNRTRSWLVSAWRLVNAEGHDLVQPWFGKKSDAREFAESQGWTINETMYSPSEQAHKENSHQ
jgi:hypothetical protein